MQKGGRSFDFGINGVSKAVWIDSKKWLKPRGDFRNNLRKYVFPFERKWDCINAKKLPDWRNQGAITKNKVNYKMITAAENSQ